MKKNYQPLIWGLGLITAGVLVFLNLTGVISTSLWDYFWPSIVIFSGIASLIASTKNIVGYMLVALGTFWLIKNLFSFEFDSILFLPLILVVVGAYIIIKLFVKIERVRPAKSGFVLFGGRTDTSFPDDFNGMNVSCLFGGYEVDLRQHNFNRDLTFDIITMFGGVDIIVPSNVNLVINPTSIFGGVDSKLENKNGNPYTVTVNAFCMFGGIDIKNNDNK